MVLKKFPSWGVVGKKNSEFLIREILATHRTDRTSHAEIDCFLGSYPALEDCNFPCLDRAQ